MAKLNNFLLIALGLVAFVSSACNICSSSGVTCPSVSLSTQDGTDFRSDLNVISFNDLTLNHGDIQGRAAVRNNFFGLNGISIGDQLVNGAQHSLIVGGNLNLDGSGAVFPVNGSVFVGGSVTSPNVDLSSRTSTCSTSGCLNAYFDAALSYWTSFSQSLANQANNVDVSFANGVASFNCQSSTANAYFITLTNTQFNNIIGYSTSNCSSTGSWVININGANDVVFGGNSIEVSGSVIFNVISAGQVYINSSVNGNIVAPSSSIQMSGGTIYGQVIAGNLANVVQINIITNCPAPSSSTSGSTSSSGASASGSASSTSSDSGSASSSGSASGSVESSSTSSSSSDSSSGAQSTTGSVASSTFGGPTAIVGQQSGDGSNNFSSASVASIAFGAIAIAALLI